MSENEDCEELPDSLKAKTTFIGGGAEITSSTYNPVKSMNIGEGFGDTPIKICPED